LDPILTGTYAPRAKPGDYPAARRLTPSSTSSQLGAIGQGLIERLRLRIQRRHVRVGDSPPAAAPGAKFLRGHRQRRHRPSTT